MRTLILSFYFLFIPLFSFALESFPGKIVEPSWLAGKTGDTGLRIVDVRARIDDYWSGHIPGAVYFNPAALTVPDTGVPAKLAPPPILASILGEMGIGENTAVVIYTDGKDYHGAAYLLWALDYLGHRSAGILDGGYRRWTKLRLPVTKAYPKVDAVPYPIDPEGGYRRGSFATTGDVETVAEKRGAVLLDTRERDLYAGEAGPWQRRGHIPGAVNRPSSYDVTGSGIWKDRELLKKSYARIGIVPDRIVIVYGSYGMASAQTYFTLKYLLGFPDVRHYDGGFSEWSGYEGLPVEKGMPPKAVPARTP